MRRWRVAAMLALAAALLAGCTTGSGSSEGADGGAPVPGPVVDEGVSGGGVEGAPDTDSRDVISQGQLVITVQDPLQAADDAVRIVERADGRIDSRIERPPVDGDGGAAQLVVRIPSADLTPTLELIERLGEVESIEISSTDVTAESQDLDARITALRASVERLVALLASATTTADLIEIETALSARQGDLESLEAQQRSLSDRVDLATVTIDFGSEETAPVDEPQNFVSGVEAGWEALVGFLAAALIVIGVAIPWLALAVIVAAAVLVVARLRRRRTGARADTRMVE